MSMSTVCEELLILPKTDTEETKCIDEDEFKNLKKKIDHLIDFLIKKGKIDQHEFIYDKFKEGTECFNNQFDIVGKIIKKKYNYAKRKKAVNRKSTSAPMRRRR